MLRDIAVLTGGEVISSELGLELKEATLEQLGHARQIKVNKDNTIIVGGAGDPEAIKARVSQIKNARSFRRDLQSFPAALPCSRSAQLPKPR